MPWLINQFPELEHLDPPQRATVLARVPWWTYPLIVGRAIFLSIIPAAVVGGIVDHYYNSIAGWAFGLLIFLGLAVAIYGYQVRQIRLVMREAVAQALLGQRPPFCFRCGYNLRESTSTACPECGALIA